MPLSSKPCERTGCNGICRSSSPSEHRRKRYCSIRCAMEARSARPEFKARAEAFGRMGGIASAPARRKAAALRAAAQLGDLIPEDLQLRLGARDLARLHALLVRAWCKGHKTRMSADRMRRSARRKHLRKVRGKAGAIPASREKKETEEFTRVDGVPVLLAWGSTASENGR